MTMLNRLRRAFSPGFGAELVPETGFAVIGDIHGRMDLLEQMIEALGGQLGPETTLVFVGDYVDRGENSADVLGALQTLQGGLWPGQVICLKGNHESMMLGFLDTPDLDGQFWLANGGMQTLASFDIRPPAPSATRQELWRTRDLLEDALGADRLTWLRGLPLSYRSGNVFVSHAGADPHSPLDAQLDEHLLWGHPDFLVTDRRDGVWVVHGHTIFETARQHRGRIGVDTGAYATNLLSAAFIDTHTCRFLTVRS